MAGIISNVTGDIQRLRELKAAIEDVKKSLKGIDVRVNIDIKESVEAQLKALSEQYTALVMKIAEAEGKIKLSVHNINKASEAIIQAQEKMSKATGVTTQQSTVTVSPSNTAAETASIQAQAKAYEDLRTEINDVLGTRDANVKRMVDEMNAIRLINAEIKVLTKSQGESGTLSSAQQKRLEQLNNSLLTHKTALSDVRQVLSNNAKMDNAAATSMNELSQSLSRMRIAYRDLTEEERKSPFGKELLSSIQQADAKIKELDSSIGNHARNVGNYKKEWNGLQNQMQMVARELPNFAISPQIGIMSLTNNLPYLADELKKAKDAHKEYVTAVKAGQKDLQKVPSVGKQVLSSLFSWQTGLIMVITLITAYRQEITEWCKGLFNAKNRLNAASEAQIRLNDAIRQGSKDAIRERTQLDLLYNKLKDTTILTKERNAAVSEWMKKYPQYTSVVNGEKTNINQLGIAYKELTRNIIASAQAKRIESLLVSGAEKQADLIGNVTNAIIARDEAQKKVNGSQSEYNKIKSKENKEILEIDKQSLNRRRKDLIEAQDSLRKQTLINEDVKKNIKLDNLFPQATKGTYDYWQQQVQIADSALKQIDSKQKELLDAGKFDGIDAAVVANYKSQSKLLEEAQKELKVYDTSSNTTKQESSTDKLRQEQEKYNLLLDKQKLDRKRQAEDLHNQVDQARINAMDEGSKKTIAQMELNFEKEMQVIDRQKEDLLRKKVEEERAAFNDNPNKKKGETFDASGIVLSDNENAYYDALYKSAIINNEKIYSELANQYLSYADQRLEIEKKYNDDIAVLQEARKKAEAKGDKGEVSKIDRSIGKRTEVHNEDVFKFDAEQLKKSMNWEQVFGNLDKVSTDTLKNLKGKLKDFIATQKDLSPENLKELVDAFEKIDEEVSERNPFEAMASSLKALKSATDDERKAQEAYNKALKEGTDEEKNNTKATLESAKNSKQKALSEATTALHNGVNEVGQYVDAGNQILGIMNTLGVQAPEWMNGFMGGVGEMLNGLESIDLMKPMSIITGGLQTIKGALVSVISLGGLIPGLGGADYSEYDAMVAKYEGLMDVWDQLLDKKKAYIKESYGAEATKAGEEALRLLNSEKQITKELASSRLDAGKSAGSHSMNYRMWKGSYDYGGQNWKDVAPEISNALGGVDFSSMWSMLEMSSEQLEWIKTNYSGLWAHMDGDFKGYLDNIMEYGEVEKEIIASVKEQITGMSLDSFQDSYVNMLSDMDSTNEDFADSFEEYLKKSILQSLIAKNYSSKIQGLYDSWATAGKDDVYTDDEIKELRDKQQQITDEMLAEREKLMKTMGWDSSSDNSSQNSTQKGFAAMSQDTGDELNGRFTALQISNEEIKNQAIINTQSLNLLTMKSDSILLVNTEVRNIADETRTILANSYLELQEIRENTGAIVKPIIQMQKDMEAIKNNTKNM